MCSFKSKGAIYVSYQLTEIVRQKREFFLIANVLLFGYRQNDVQQLLENNRRGVFSIVPNNLNGDCIRRSPHFE